MAEGGQPAVPGPALAQRLARLPPSATIAMTMRARQLRESGRPVISLSIGQPDFPTPDHAIAAAHAAALRGETKYPPVDGTPALKSAIIRKFARENGLDLAPNQIMVANGGKQVIYNALMATVDAGDEVIIPAPYYGAYLLMVQLCGGLPVVVPAAEADGFRLSPEALEAAITPRTRWLFLNHPNNPTGAAMEAGHLAALAEVLRRHPDVWILSDEIYEHLLFDGRRPASIAAIAPDLAARVLVVNGVSKTYAMTGWRVGYGAGNPALIRAMVNMQGQVTTGVCTVAQAAAAAVLDGPQELVAERAAIYAARRDKVLGWLADIPGLRCPVPDGAFYLFPHIGGCIGKVSAGGRRIGTDVDFAAALLEEQDVAVVHGTAFGMSPYLRLSYATDEASLREACARIERFCRGLTAG